MFSVSWKNRYQCSGLDRGDSIFFLCEMRDLQPRSEGENKFSIIQAKIENFR